MILKKLFFPKSNKISKWVSIHVLVFKLGQEELFNNNTIREKVLIVSFLSVKLS